VKFRPWTWLTTPPQLEDQFGCRMLSAKHRTVAEQEALTKQVAALGPWFHNYEIANGVWTNPNGKFPGIDYPRRRFDLIAPFLPDLNGKSCLDVGCSSGFFSLKLKELGAGYVLGIDFEHQPHAIAQAQFAARALNLDVEFRTMSVYDLPTLQRSFDLVLFMGVFYHLRHPLLGLEAVRTVCNGVMIFQSITTRHTRRFAELDNIKDVDLHATTLEDDEYPSARFVENTLNGDATCWFVPNLQGVAAMLRASYFELGPTVSTNNHDIFVRCT
jgi:tRNA (mo5U34)-methyltransferase